MRKPSLKCFLKTELDWFKSGQHLPYERLALGTCSPLLGVGFWFCRICTHINLKIPNSVLYHAFMFKTRSSRLHTFSLLLSFCYHFWKYFESTKLCCFCHSCRKAVNDSEKITIVKYLWRRRGETSLLIRKINDNCIDLACTWESNKKNSIDPIPTWGFSLLIVSEKHLFLHSLVTYLLEDNCSSITNTVSLMVSIHSNGKCGKEKHKKYFWSNVIRKINKITFIY